MAKMTIRDCMDFALQLLNQYSITGTLVPLSYNDQADTELRMINLINDAQMQIAITVKPIEVKMEIEVPEPEKNEPIAEIATEMPEDFIDMTALYFTSKRGRVTRTVDASVYKWIGDTTLILPGVPLGTYTLMYSRYPERYSKDVSFDTELDNTPDTHEIIPYFVAAMIALDENPKAYSALYNVWETRLSRLGMKNPKASAVRVDDVYGFDRGLYGGIW